VQPWSPLTRLLRAGAQGNAWAALWAAAPATPAAQQAPLMDAEAEGERALHALVRRPPCIACLFSWATRTQPSCGAQPRDWARTRQG
jgi:Rab3 GTPase-activating protein catalytic subunit